MKRTLARLALPGLLAFAPAGAPGAEVPFEDLIANLKSPTAKTRQEAAAALGKSQRREAVAPLSALVRDPEPRVRLEVAHALRTLRDPSAVPALVTALEDGDPKVREEATVGLVEIYGERISSGPMKRFLETFSDEYDRSSIPAYVVVDPSVYRGLTARLRDEEKAIREAAAYALGILGGSVAAPDLVTALQDPDSGVRGAAATSLGKVGGAEDGRTLVPLLADDSAEVRNRTIQAVGVLRVKEAGPALRELYEQNRRRESGTRILAALARVSDPAQADLFRELLSTPDPERRALAVEGLARVSTPAGIDAFKIDFQRERNDGVRLAYAFAIALLGDRAFLDTVVLSLPSGTQGRRARSYLMELGPTIVPDLYPYLNDQDAGVRGSLCEILGDLGGEGTIARLQPLLNDPNTGVADRANRAIERLRRAGSSSSIL
jgi:HEAT repeat protein